MTDTPKVVTRFAPSPTGFLHIGGARTALFAWAHARRHGGIFILRIEDTDRDRYNPEATEQIIRSMTNLGITCDYGPHVGGPHGSYIQSERCQQGIYAEHAEKLIASGHAYKCWCAKTHVAGVYACDDHEDAIPQPYNRHCRYLNDAEKAKLEGSCAPYVVRLAVPEKGVTVVYDEARGKIPYDNKTLTDQVLIKSDGMPTYHMAAIVDDHLMGVTHVIRGVEWLSSTPLHFLLYSFFGWERPKFVHVAEVWREDGKKYSKRDKDAAVDDYLDNAGYIPEGLLNGLVLTGFTPGDGKEFMNPYTDFPAHFDLKRIVKASAKFHVSRAIALNRKHMAKIGLPALTKRVIPYLVRAGLVTDPTNADFVALMEKLVPMLPNRINLLSEAPDLMRGFFVTPNPDRAKLVDDTTTVEIADGRLSATADAITALATVEAASIKDSLMGLASADASGKAAFFKTLYVAITGSEKGLPVMDTIEILGRPEVLARIARARAVLA